MANASMFSKRAVASAQSLIREHLQTLSQQFERETGTNEPLDLQTTFLAYTTDTLYEYMFDMETGYQRDHKAAQAWKNSMGA